MRLDTAARTATLSTKEVVGFGVALVATGANVRRLRVDGAQLQGIHYLRALGNADAIRADARGGRARRPRRRLLHRVRGRRDADAARPPLHDGDARGRAALVALRPDGGRASSAALLREHGVELVTGDGLERLEGEERVERVVTASGRTLDADMVVMGTGAMPDVMLARAAEARAGGDGRRGLHRRPRDVRPRRSGRPATCASTTRCCTAAGCGSSTTRSRSRRAARRRPRCSATRAPFAELPYFWTDLADWATAEWVGVTEAPEHEVVRGSVEDGAFSVLHLAGGRLVAALSVGRGEDLAHARRLIAARTDLAGREAELAGGDLDAL